MPIKIFITGTDTEVGKTYITTGLLKAFNEQNFSTIGVKPVASDCFREEGELYNHDALMLQQASSIKLDYNKINPFAFEPPIAPHIAAQQMQCRLDVSTVKQKCSDALNYPADICLIEGVGGWDVPLNDAETMSDFVKSLGLKVVMVIGIRLGCLNHAILTYKAIQETNLPLIGWVANCIDNNMRESNANIATLENWLPVPCLGIVRYQQKAEQALNIDILLKYFS